MSDIEIPKGWRKLQVGETIKSGDRFRYGKWSVIRKIQKQEKPRRQKRQKRWVNLYPDGHWSSATTKKVADLCASNRIACVKVMM